jgi:hypothetical protein
MHHLAPIAVQSFPSDQTSTRVTIAPASQWHMIAIKGRNNNRAQVLTFECRFCGYLATRHRQVKWVSLLNEVVAVT